MGRIGSLEELAQCRQAVLSRRDPDASRISVCAGTGCLATGASRVLDALRNEIEKQGLADTVEIRVTCVTPGPNAASCVVGATVVGFVDNVE